ncbi:hypothetical protein QR90_08725 [Deinococcus radiopugnans]|uniref:Uncharacterized protein n=1 Tax=Deinococcus radiopugnans TaxID=57497 RepID=A0A0A7KGD8_9DEIO|nr:hypothetical protein [Deinococcus radiopugnans]AIZ45170.1 hypothetical protein QR90_08725 [Deinococcus radiopugnans]
MTRPQIHEYTLPLFPTALQVRALDALSALTQRIECAAVQQARLDMTTSLAALLGGPDHAERSDEAEIRALLRLPAMAAVPSGLVRQAVTGRRARTARSDLAAPARPTPVSGEGLILPATPGGLILAGVPGIVTVGTDKLPPWAAQVWRHAAGGAKPTLDPRLVTASVTGWAYIERGSYAGTPGWLIDIALDWDAYPTWRLMRDGDGWGDGPWRREVRHLMV